jgi:hypothetical protein
MLTNFIILTIMGGSRRFVHSETLDCPIENVLMLKATTIEKVLKKLLVFCVIRCFLEL